MLARTEEMDIAAGILPLLPMAAKTYRAAQKVFVSKRQADLGPVTVESDRDPSLTVQDCLRVHRAHDVAGDGTPEWSGAFTHHIAVACPAPRRDIAPPPAGRDWLTPPEVARILGVNRSTISRLILRGVLPSYQPGGEFGHHRVDINTLRDYLDKIELTSERRVTIDQAITRMVEVA